MATSKLQQAAAAKKTTTASTPAGNAAVRTDDPIKEKNDNRIAGNKAPVGTEVTTKAVLTALAVSTGLMDMEQDAGMGLEGADKDSFALPFIAVLQGLSPQLKTLEGARPGLLINTVTNELFKELRVVPVAFQRRYNRWTPRSEGGGFKGTLTVAEVEGLIASKEAKEVKQMNNGKESTVLMYEGTVLKDTRNHFVLVVNEDGSSWKPALISCASTQIKRSRRWLSVINGLELTGSSGKKFTPPSFSHIYTVSSESESNNQGEWESFLIELESKVEDADLYKAAKDFHAQVTAGIVVAAPPPESMDVEEVAVGESTGKKF